jgi:hypothetical protein
VLALLLLLCSSKAAADEHHFGPFLCPGCGLSYGVIGQPPDGETQIFIQQVANAMNDTGLDGYQMGDTVTICDGETCATYARALAGFVLVYTEPDAGGPYVNDAGGGEGGGGGGYSGGPGSGTGGMNGDLVPIYASGSVCFADGSCTTYWVIVGYQFIPRPGNHEV